MKFFKNILTIFFLNGGTEYISMLLEKLIGPWGPIVERQQEEKQFLCLDRPRSRCTRTYSLLVSAIVHLVGALVFKVIAPLSQSRLAEALHHIPKKTMSQVKAPGAPAPGTFLFTSESVNEGHPDKICDQVSDAVLDACLREDDRSRVACESCTKTGMVMIFGEITTNANVNYEQVIRDAIKEIGYDDTAKGLDYKTCSVAVAVEEQSPDIAQSVDSQRIEDLGAGDQGIMFGYATDETESLMPLSHELATHLGARLTEVRKNGICAWCRPDGKTQVLTSSTLQEIFYFKSDART